MTALVLSPTVRFLNVISKLALWLAGIGLVLMTVLIAYQVFSRYVLNSSPSWTEAASTMLMTWFIFLGAAIGVREGYHLGFDVLLAIGTPRAQSIMRSLSDLVVLGFGAGMVVCGMQLVMGTWNTTLPALELPGGTSYLPLVAGGALMCLFTVERLLQRLGSVEPVLENLEG
ncbi:MAG: TRAP transporter small permease [Phyllobacterium sp.]|uniref:TRAP transporter small permease n=1 Tax=Phyllobacterium sp. TaxID=1871046 RepID=UPI0030F0DA76